ncbi:EF-P 5-aminopentanol modification-associated protein YfmH [Yanshouia hominis]|uniref:Insulinase family protein n=1 Tax=Yanshouia hominis TaxID=2763673 RepID=A0ABR7NJL2_9FIRM|nr:pitrilysin family protein [Yanshouia hominis]MBC8576601.1 insulinase family protein [Yanshouia hominis]
MLTESVASRRLGEGYTRIEHPSGLTLMLCPMKGYSTAYALFAARCGSIDDSFSTGDGEMVQVPNGIAHFLEHKLFESEEGDAFEQYAKTGASANAYTSFDRTAYLFGCTDRFRESLEILLNLVTTPYFTEQTVQKEQGIIGQEIRMYDDDPDWRVYFNLLGALYQEHPIRIDIAGTVESIAEISADLLYRCYNAFYNLNNMVLSIAGNFEIKDVVEACDKILKPAAPVRVSTREVREPDEIRARRVEQTLEVAAPLFQIGFKGRAKSYRENILAQVTGELVCDLIAGESTALYRELYDEGLINAVFDTEVMAGPNYLVNIFSGESRDPDAVFARLTDGVRALQERGISEEDFERARRAAYGRYVGIYGNVESMAGMMVLAKLADFGAYEPLDLLGELTLNDAQAFLRENFDTERCALSVVRGPREARA